LLERAEEVLVHVVGLVVAGGLLQRLQLEPLPLVHRVRQLAERVCELPPNHEQLETLRASFEKWGEANASVKETH
jgi:hypothetical protein